MGSRVRIERWSGGDLDLLRRANAPEMMDHLGGPETEEQLAVRHARYVGMTDAAAGRMYRIVVDRDGEGPGEEAGTIGYWERQWEGETVYEAGWAVLPAFQGQGVASAAARAVAEEAARHGHNRYLHAFPKTDHPGSNGVCRRAGFELLAECDFEYPPGHRIRTNDWRLDLSPGAGRSERR
ncbi:GNAT family N-acetyltransferase [Streptomyces sp. NBC_01465]|uniref:GNAT family N-acetyltransferase n=1 Tax=Streptomyces sp. NBC_01465 TaxID=2903878 RepID=UPI002E307B44|nr:GNAT family N-acetyltransferase [Streptomyces sp. NBC_01465]